MDAMRPHRFKPFSIVSGAILLGALVVGAAGESLLAPRVSDLANATVAQVTASVDSARSQVSSLAGQRETTASVPKAPVSEATPAPASAIAPPLSVDQPYVAVVQKAGPAVVTVVNQMAPTRTGFGGISQPEALGSGVIIDKDGDIVTNNHVIQGSNSLQVIFSDGRKVNAKLVGRDSISDLAVLKVNTDVPAVAEFGDSTKLEPGEQVVTIGSALGNFRNTVTHGIVSGLDRTLSDSSGPGLSGLIQTDAPINHGNSGGPLLNLQGEVIGINTAVVRSTGMGGDVAEGLGFAIPSETVKQITQQLITNGTVPRPYLGVSYAELSPQVASYYGIGADQGALINSVEPGSPADKAGLKPGDVITAIDNQKLDEEHSLAGTLLEYKIGDAVKLTVTRNGSSVTLTASLDSRPADTQ